MPSILTRMEHDGPLEEKYQISNSEVCVCVCVCGWVCVCVVYACMYMYICIHNYVYVHAHIHTHTNTHTHTHTHTGLLPDDGYLGDSTLTYSAVRCCGVIAEIRGLAGVYHVVYGAVSHGGTL
jgi:hypothetical protein